MQALRFEKTGSFDELALRTIAKPSLAPGEALVRVNAAGINGVSHLLLSCPHFPFLFQPLGNPSLSSSHYKVTMLIFFPIRRRSHFVSLRLPCSWDKSDAAAVLGTLPFVTLPRTPGRDFSGEVVEALDDVGAPANAWIGAHVWGTGSERGFTSDGTFAE
jgi:NADPH:quinone reductase-like Zn-dependent oxidoreductase